MNFNHRYKSMFGYEIESSEDKTNLDSFSPKQLEDGSINIATGGVTVSHVDLDANFKNDMELITRYREISQQPEIESAIEEIVNEAIVLEAINSENEGKIVEIILDQLTEKYDLDVNIKVAIETEFYNVLKLLDFTRTGYDIFKRYYIDGRVIFHKVIDSKNINTGIQELRYIDPRKIKKVVETKSKKDQKTGANIVKVTNEYYLYNDKIGLGASIDSGVKITLDCISYISSGITDPNKGSVLSYLHSTIRPLNLLRMLSDATVIHKIGRSTNRRIFYVDTGGLPKPKAEQYLFDMMTKFKNKIVYDASLGQVRSDRKNMSILEDYWIPRRNGQDTTTIETLKGDDTGFTDMSTLEYFQKELYKSLHVPLTRLLPQETFNMGKANEITRDEIKFNKFIEKLRNKFSALFDDILGTQLVLKGVCTEEEWKVFKSDIYYNFGKENYHNELLKADIIRERLSLLMVIDPYVGKFYSKKWVQKNILHLHDDNIQEMDIEMQNEMVTDIEHQSQMLQLQTKYGLVQPGEQQQ